MPETVNLYLSDQQAKEARALAARWGTPTVQAAIREAIHLAADERSATHG